MRVRLTQSGFKTYTGQMGVVFFENGLSTDDVSTKDAVRMAAVMNCEWEDGSSLSPSQLILDSKHNAAPVARNPVSVVAQAAPADVKVEVVAEAAPVDVKALYTQAELEAIADSKGIAGLREVAAKHDIKGRSVNDIIADLVKAGFAKPSE